MVKVSITDFRKNLKKYCELVQQQDYEIVRRNKVVFIIKSTKSNKEDALNSLVGAAKSDICYEDVLKNKISEL